MQCLTSSVCETGAQVAQASEVLWRQARTCIAKTNIQKCNLEKYHTVIVAKNRADNVHLTMPDV